MTIPVKHAGSWKESEPHVRNAGAWKPVDTGFVKDDGVWKEAYSAEVLLPAVIGEPFGGGFYAGDMTYPNGDVYAIICAPKAAEIRGIWKTAATPTSGTDSDYDDRANTLAMDSEDHPAAMHCLGYRGGGFDDWSLPARDTLALVYNNKDAWASGTEAFEGNYYWASTQESPPSGYAWVKNFATGVQFSTGTKTARRWVRPVRRIKRN